MNCGSGIRTGRVHRAAVPIRNWARHVHWDMRSPMSGLLHEAVGLEPARSVTLATESVATYLCLDCSLTHIRCSGMMNEQPMMLAATMDAARILVLLFLVSGFGSLVGEGLRDYVDSRRIHMQSACFVTERAGAIASRATMIYERLPKAIQESWLRMMPH